MLKRTGTILHPETYLDVSPSSALNTSTLLCSQVAILHPNPRAYLPVNTEYFTSLITCKPTCHLPAATGPICSCGSRMNTNVDLHLFSPGISDP